MATGAVARIGKRTGETPVPPGAEGKSTGKMPVPPEQGNEDLERELAEFAAGRPYDEARVIERTQAGFTQGVHGFYLAGLGLNLIHKHENVQTFAQIIEQHFPGISLRTAYGYMRFAKAASALPNFKQFALASGGYSKALTMLEVCSGEEVQEFETTGDVLGYTAEDLRLMSARQMRQALLRAREKEKASVRRETAKAAGEIAELRDQVRDLAAQVPGETPVDAAMALIRRAEEKVLDGLRMLGNVERRTIATSQVVRDAIYGLSGLAYRVLENLSTEISELAAAAEEDQDA